MSTAIKTDKGPILHTKGASEIILSLCDKYIDHSGTSITLSDTVRNSLTKTIESFASEGFHFTLTFMNNQRASNLIHSLQRA